MARSGKGSFYTLMRSITVNKPQPINVSMYNSLRDARDIMVSPCHSYRSS
jgi:hypothetical protein